MSQRGGTRAASWSSSTLELLHPGADLQQHKQQLQAAEVKGQLVSFDQHLLLLLCSL